MFNIDVQWKIIHIMRELERIRIQGAEKVIVLNDREQETFLYGH